MILSNYVIVKNQKKKLDLNIKKINWIYHVGSFVFKNINKKEFGLTHSLKAKQNCLKPILYGFLASREMNWYLKSQTINRLQKEALSSNIPFSILMSVVMILSGLSVDEAIAKTKAPKDQVENALENPNVLQKARSFVSENEVKEIFDEEPIGPSNTAMPTTDSLKQQLSKHEGYRRKVYKDTKGNPTIGIGFNLNKSTAKNLLKSVGADYNKIIAGEPLSEQQIDQLFQYDLQTAIGDARKFLPNFDTLPTPAKSIIIDMAFNLGYNKLSDFTKLRNALLKRDFNEAANQMQASKWYNDVKNRGVTLVNAMRSLSKT